MSDTITLAVIRNIKSSEISRVFAPGSFFVNKGATVDVTEDVLSNPSVKRYMERGYIAIVANDADVAALKSGEMKEVKKEAPKAESKKEAPKTAEKNQDAPVPENPAGDEDPKAEAKPAEKAAKK